MAAREVQASKRLYRSIDKAVEQAMKHIRLLQARIVRTNSEVLQKKYARNIAEQEFFIQRLLVISSTLRAEIDRTVVGYVSALAADQIGDLRDSSSSEFDDAREAINDFREEQWEDEDAAAADAIDHKNVDVDRIIEEAKASMLVAAGPNTQSDDAPIAAAPPPPPPVATRHARRPSVTHAAHAAHAAQVGDIEQQLERLLPRMDDLPRLVEDDNSRSGRGGGNNGPLPVPAREQAPQSTQRPRTIMPSFFQ